MKLQKQLNRHKPSEGIYGDCQRTCFAMMFDLDAKDVPHFLEDGLDNELFHTKIDAWLKQQGYRQFFMVFNDCTLKAVLDHMLALNPNFYYILSGQSRNLTDHSVVCFNNKIIADPALDDSGIIGPCSDGLFWITVFVPNRFSEECSYADRKAAAKNQGNDSRVHEQSDLSDHTDGGGKTEAHRVGDEAHTCSARYAN